MKKNIKTARYLLVFLLVLMAVGMANPARAENDACETALARCLLDPINRVTFEGTWYCLNGYIFCKKYLEG